MRASHSAVHRRGLQRRHAEAYARLARWVRPLPGSIELLRYLTEARIPWSIAARRTRGLGVGVLSGGYGQDELERSGAIRVYEDPADLLRHIDEIGGRRG